MQPIRDLRSLSSPDRQQLDEIDLAISRLDRAFAFLSDDAFARLPREHRRLADAVLAVYRERRARVA